MVMARSRSLRRGVPLPSLLSTKRYFERGVHDKELIMIGSLFVQGVVLLLLHYSEINFKFSYLIFYFLIFP